MRDFIERLQAKPEHVRHRIAFFSSFSLTAVVAVAWFAAVANSGVLTLAPLNASSGSGFGALTDTSALVKDTSTGWDDLLGAVGAAGGTSSGDPTLSIVDERASSTLDRNAVDERTVIPF